MTKHLISIITLILTLCFFSGEISCVFAAEQGESEFTLEEIIVTAEKREENLQKVSMSMSVVQGDDLVAQNLSSLQDILKDIPNVSTSAQGTGYTINIRGLGQDLPPEVGEASVSMNIDGSHQGRTESTVFGFFDVDRVEVLRGPQGTLYGRNATGGVVNIVSAKPKPDVVEGYGSIGLASYNTWKSEGVVNVPISKKWAARIGFSTAKQDAYLKDSDGKRNTSWNTGTRVQLRYQATEDAFANLMVNYVQRTGDIMGVVTPANWEKGIYDVNDETVPWNHLRTSKFRQYKVQLNTEFPVGPGIVSFIPTYDYNDGRTFSLSSGRDGTPIDPVAVTEGGRGGFDTTTAELRYASKSDSTIKWVVGVYYSGSDEKGMPRAPDPTQLKYMKSYAMFSQVTYPFQDTLRLIMGLRADKDKKGYEHILNVEEPWPTSNSFSFSYTDWKVGIEQDFSDSIMQYFTLSTGHRPGGYAEFTGAPFDEEALMSYEYGLKSRLMNNRLQLNGSIYYYDYKGYQAVDGWRVEDPESPSGWSMKSIFFNVDKARAYGLELESQYLIGSATSLNLTFTTMKNKYLSDFYVHESMDNPVATNQKGKPMPHSPNFTIGGGIDHSFTFSSGDTLKPRLSAKYTDEQYIGVFISPDTLIPAYTLVDASLTYLSTHNWTLNLYANNALNEHYVSGGQPGRAFWPGPPQVIGFNFMVNF
jgi:iron complex outermembrane recepter protein